MLSLTFTLNCVICYLVLHVREDLLVRFNPKTLITFFTPVLFFDEKESIEKADFFAIMFLEIMTRKNSHLVRAGRPSTASISTIDVLDLRAETLKLRKR